MFKSILNINIVLLIFLGLIKIVQGSDKDSKVYKKQAPLSKEKSLTISIDYGNGYINFGKIRDVKNIYEGEFIYMKSQPDVRYEVVGDEGRLDIHFSGKLRRGDEDDEVQKITSFDKLYENELNLNFSPDIPLNLDLELGVIKGVMDLGDLQVRNLDLEVGIGKGSLLFDKPNPVVLEFCSIEGGVGKLQIEKLGNANMREFKFEGGVGSYELDFSGDFRSSCSAQIELGMGKMKLYLPHKIGTRLKIDKSFLSSCTIDEVYKSGDYYYNENWEKTEYNLDLKVETGVGKIEIVWINN